MNDVDLYPHAHEVAGVRFVALLPVSKAQRRMLEESPDPGRLADRLMVVLRRQGRLWTVIEDRTGATR
jgi:Lon protease-like protein